MGYTVFIWIESGDFYGGEDKQKTYLRYLRRGLASLLLNKNTGKVFCITVELCSCFSHILSWEWTTGIRNDIFKTIQCWCFEHTKLLNVRIKMHACIHTEMFLSVKIERKIRAWHTTQPLGNFRRRSNKIPDFFPFIVNTWTTFHEFLLCLLG